MDKLSKVIYYIVNCSGGIDRLNLGKAIYYTDGVYFQRNGKTITGERYIHLENCPQPVRMNQCILELVSGQVLKAEPYFCFETSLSGFRLIANKDLELDLEKAEVRKIRKVVQAFLKSKDDESMVYPNLYENYVITPLYNEIFFSPETINTKIHFFKQRRLLNLYGKIFKINYQ
ncbi:MAG: DUF4065 domain-containing protein [Leptospiraceae bacterium]|nr:DUF4065 domain-containing protein [Leptospiraceae bacterium]MCP5499937.1 DUF4065 domain-containing protein [Leptospiraceae bacterium]